MKKFDKIKLGRIVLDENTNKKFLDFENNQDVFCDGTISEYYTALYNYVKKVVYNSRISGEMILNKTFVSNVLRIIKDDILIKNKLSELVYLELVHYIYVYYETINIIKLSGLWPYNEEDEKVQIEAVNLLEKQIDEIIDFLIDIDYDKRVMEILEPFKKLTKKEEHLSKEEFDTLDLIFSTAHNIPQEYVDLYLKSIMKDSQVPSEDSLKNAISSFIGNHAYKNGSFCFTDICNLKIGTLGTYENHVISISNKVFNKFFLNYTRRKRTMLDTIFHELTHLYQEELYEQEILPYEYIIMLKDYLLTNTLSNRYCEDNYYSLANELDARRLGTLQTNEYLASIGIMPKENTLKIIEKDKKKNGKIIRYYEGKETNPDELFDEKIQEIISSLNEEFEMNLFEEYPIFKFFYHPDGKRKTTLELLKEKHKTKDKTIKLQITDILKNRKLSKENIMSDLEELILDRSEELEDDEDVMISLLSKQLSKKEKNIVLVRIKTIGLRLKEAIKNIGLICTEIEEMKAEASNTIADTIILKMNKNKK